MNLDPKKVFIDRTRFISIVAPGSMLTRPIVDEASPVVPEACYAKLDGVQPWAYLRLTIYLLSHLIFLLGFRLYELFDWARLYTQNSPIAPLARRGHLAT